MRARSRSLRLARLACLATFASVGLWACQSAPPPAAPPPPRRADEFQPEAAWGHLSALAAIGPRVMGSEGGARARGYIVEQLAALGIETHQQKIQLRRGEDQPPLELVNVGGVIPGESSDVLLLAAPYDSRHFETFENLGVNDGASGAAVLLELARVLSVRPLPYTTWIVFLDGEAAMTDPDGNVQRQHYGARALSQRLTSDGAIDAIRLAIFMNRVGDADLRIARDLSSNRIYREEVWKAAARLGKTDAFGKDATFQSPESVHRPFTTAGMSRVVVLVDMSFGGDDPPGIYANSENDDLEHASAESLATVGEVTLESLATISARLAKIDRFVESPLVEIGASDIFAEPDAAATAEPAVTEPAVTEPAVTEPEVSEPLTPAEAETPEPAEEQVQEATEAGPAPSAVSPETP